MTIQEAAQILRTLPYGVSVAVGRELDLKRPLEAHRVLSEALGDGRTAQGIVAALIRYRLTGQ